MSKSSEYVKKWRKSVKNIILQCMGNECQICGYNKCSTALELHHINEEEKEFSFGFIMSSCRNWHVIYNEIKKCILLCANCHREVHAKLIQIPDNYKIFDEKYADNLRTTFSLKSQKIRNDSFVAKAKVRQKTVIRKTKILQKDKMEKKNWRIGTILSSKIDFSKFGWGKELSQVINIESAALVRWIKKHMPEFYEEKCFKNKFGSSSAAVASDCGF